MKYLLITLATMMVAVGCGKHEVATPAATPSDLGKNRNYFAGRYGAATDETKKPGYSFAFPGVGKLVNLSTPFTVQKYAGENLSVVVLFPESSGQAVWVDYSMSHPWTEEQLKAALGAYDNEWTEIIANTGVSALGETLLKAMVPAQTAVTYKSKSGVLAYKLINDLMIYSSGLATDIKAQLAAEEQNRNTVPKF